MAAFPFRNTLSLKREPGQRLGMSLSSVEGEPISVIDITDGTLVAQSQMVNVGDVVVAVNGENMLPVPGESSEQTHAKVGWPAAGVMCAALACFLLCTHSARYHVNSLTLTPHPACVHPCRVRRRTGSASALSATTSL